MKTPKAKQLVYKSPTDEQWEGFSQALHRLQTGLLTDDRCDSLTAAMGALAALATPKGSAAKACTCLAVANDGLRYGWVTGLSAVTLSERPAQVIPSLSQWQATSTDWQHLGKLIAARARARHKMPQHLSMLRTESDLRTAKRQQDTEEPEAVSGLAPDSQWVDQTRTVA